MFGAETDEVKSVSVKEGESVTLNPDLTQIQKISKIVWMFGDKGPVIAEIIKNEMWLTETNEIFKDRLQLDHQTGSLTINNMKTKHSGLYEVHIEHKDDGPSSKKFSVKVFSKLFSSLCYLINEIELN